MAAAGLMVTFCQQVLSGEQLAPPTQKPPLVIDYEVKE
jgi:hypothetical protein